MVSTTGDHAACFELEEDLPTGLAWGSPPLPWRFGCPLTAVAVRWLARSTVTAS
jgi:hypothetical protein